VLESAAVAVASPFGEQEVKVVAALRPGASLAPQALARYLAEVLPRYMRPRYLEIRAEELPKTPTGKVRKPDLREAGAAGAWDSEAEASDAASDG
jgi:crotonobetaine/carnitine-CoA ligase